MDLTPYIEWVKEKYPDNQIILRIDDQRLEYADPQVMEDEGLDEFEYYSEYCTNEAESDVIEEIVREVEQHFNIKFETEDFIALGKLIASYAEIEGKY